jgi:hypothetical protein
MNLQQAHPRFAGSLTVAIVMAAALAGCGGGGGGGPNGGAATSGGTGTQVNNQALVTVDVGPPRVNALNTLYTSVTVCAPGSTTACQTIDHVQVDTGSTGFRVLAAALGNGVTSSQLGSLKDASGNALVECTQFADGYSWGPVKVADLKIAGETASSVSVQVIGDPAYPSSSIPAACINIPNAEEDTVLQFGANGILGIGNFVQDCGPVCTTVNSYNNGSAYNLCTAATPATCQPAAVALSQQVSNPVASFASDNNGVLIVLPAVPAAGASNSAGMLVFGIGTQSDNALGSATVYALDPNYGTLLTVYSGVTLQSFVDSGSNAYFFPDGSITVCKDQSSFYCPPSPLALTAQLQGTNGKAATLSFTVSNADAVTATVAAAPDLGGPDNSLTQKTFDWGLPFFYGRTVYVGFETAKIGGVVGPLIAF